MDKEFVAIAKILGAHGIKGEVRIRCDLENSDDFAKYKIYDDQGNEFKAEVKGLAKNRGLIIKIADINDRDEAAKLANSDLFIKREDMPELEDEYYYHDIIGLEVIDEEGQVFGEVVDMYNYGGGETLDIKKLNGKIEAFAFTESQFPIVDVERGNIKIKF